LLAAPPTDPDVSNSLIRFVSNQKLASARLGLTRNLPASGAQLGYPGLRNCWSSSALDELIGYGWRPQRVFRPPAQRTLCPVSPSLRWVHWVSVPHHPRRSSSTIGTMLHYDNQLPLSVASLLARDPIPGVIQCIPRKQLALPSYRVAPVNTCPALRPRWYPSRLPYRTQDCCLLPVGKHRLWGRILLRLIQ
jgi:hypothetical protein